MTDKLQNGWTDQIQFSLGPHMTPGKVYGLKKIVFKKFFIFAKLKKSNEKNLNIQNFLLLLYRRENAERLSNN